MTQDSPTRFALLGAAGYIAPRHLKAIKETGGTLVAAMDPSDSVGVMDTYFPSADFFTEFERFDRHMDKIRRQGSAVEYVSICSPNYLHDAHIRFAVRSRARPIVEKPVVVNPWNIDALQDIERESGVAAATILQLRHHPAIIELRDRYRDSTRVVDVDVTYVTSRGKWYQYSWKGDVAKSGGIATNIGVHFFDMLGWVFGPESSSTVHVNRPECASGVLCLARARVRWFLSIDARHLPAGERQAGRRTYRSVKVDGREVEFSDGFGDLHTESYAAILDGRGFGLADARAGIETAYRIRTARESARTGDYHPLCASI